VATINTAVRAVDRLTEATNALNDPAVFQAARHLGIEEQLADLVWRVGNLAAQIDPNTGTETETDNPHPFGAATEREN